MTRQRPGRSSRTVFVALLAIYVTLPAVLQAQWATSGNDIYATNSGNVGIGTASPSGLLTIRGNTPSFFIEDTAASGQSFFLSSRWGGYLTIWNPNYSTPWLSLAPNGGMGVGVLIPGNKIDVAGNAVIGSGYASGGAYAPANGLLVEGNVGIGTATPSAKLDVAGDVVVSGNISAKYQDIAEWVPAARQIEPGTVVVVDPDGTNTVLPSSQAYDTRVAGVVSATPGIVLGEQAEGKVKVATTGRVRVRVDASRGEVRAGDLLVTSDREGVAMRSEPVNFGGINMHRPGTLIGKALEPLSEGEAEILVLLSLQ